MESQNAIKEVQHFDKLISETLGRFVREKVYHTSLDVCKTIGGGCVMWCNWNHKKGRWNKWHVHYFIPGHDQYWSDFNEFIKAIEIANADYLKYGQLFITK